MTLAAISTDDVENAKNMALLVEADYFVLSDSDARVAREYGVFDLHGDGVAAPATFLLNSDGEIVGYHVGKDITDRPTPEQILDQLDMLITR